LLGAPLGHDFAVISLSDRLTPWETIERRLRAAAQGDFAICLYNPGSAGRRGHLKTACGILLETLPPDRICGLARSIGRPGEAAALTTLGALENTEVDMFTTVFIGSSQTRAIDGKMVTPRGYRNG
jgi:precorrin-3B C17-methyltransferase